MLLHLDEKLDYEILESSIASMPKGEKTEDEIVQEAMEHPIGSPRLSELAAGKQKVVIICSDHTRPVPSRHIIPFMLREIREGNPQADITLLIATGFHRATTREELVDKFGEEIVANEKIEIHDSRDMQAMTDLGVLPSGAPLLINKIAAQADTFLRRFFRWEKERAARGIQPDHGLGKSLLRLHRFTVQPDRHPGGESDPQGYGGGQQDGQAAVYRKRGDRCGQESGPCGGRGRHRGP